MGRLVVEEEGSRFGCSFPASAVDWRNEAICSRPCRVSADCSTFTRPSLAGAGPGPPVDDDTAMPAIRVAGEKDGSAGSHATLGFVSKRARRMDREEGRTF